MVVAFHVIGVGLHCAFEVGVHEDLLCSFARSVLFCNNIIIIIIHVDDLVYFFGRLVVDSTDRVANGL